MRPAETADRRFEADPVDPADALMGAVSAAAADSGLICGADVWDLFMRRFSRECKRRGLL